MAHDRVTKRREWAKNDTAAQVDPIIMDLKFNPMLREYIVTNLNTE